ncbi:sigma-70 family RNA polymerase sigma factor [Bacillus sp. CGMCC 1.16607]|uniref:sigma-70 family RNA polymerase sigma factor n=1 Tax=Bacillus sp. CGMCC 1.16607 TaxID=3351842 RepID=UPI00362706A6
MTLSSEIEIHDLSNPLRDVKKLFDEMIVPYRPELWRYCYFITGSPWDAEDLVQETLIKAFASIAQLWQPIHPKSYLFRIASNSWIDQCRKTKIKIDPFENVSESFYQEEIDIFEIENAIEQLVLYLSPRQRVVFLLMDVFKFSSKEVGEIIGTTEGATKALLHRARGKLKQFNEDKEVLENGSNTISDENREIINLFLDAFNRRDPNGIAKLLDTNVSNDIVHIAKELGKDIVEKYSLTDWSKDPVEMRAEIHMLWGLPTIVQIGKMNGGNAIYNLNHIKIEHGKIVEIKDYYFCPELLHEAAIQLNLTAFQRNYTL